MLDNLLLISTLPPMLVLVLGFLTHRVIFSLSAGLLLASLLSNQFDIISSCQTMANTLWRNFEIDKVLNISQFWNSWNLFICIFLMILGIFVALLQHSGGAFAYGDFVKKKIKSLKAAQTSSLVLSMLLFLDDYFSSLTVGSVMQPITDKFKLPRAKLAFLVDSMAAPLAILCPFSSWVAAILGFLRENGVNEDYNHNVLILASPLTTYFHIIPYIFYSFLTIFACWFIVRANISFNLMHKHEYIAATTGQLLGGKDYPKLMNNSIEPTHGNLNDFMIPIFILLICVISGMLFSGNWQGFLGDRNFIQALQYSSAAMALFTGGSIALIITTLFFIVRNRIKISKLHSIYLEGIKLMLPAILVLMLAWSLGDLLRNELHTGENLAKLMINTVNVNWLPTILFFTATLIAFAIGSSWGAAAMLFPIAIPMVIAMQPNLNVLPPTLEHLPILFPVLGATLAGCVAGDHISPISDTTIMSATSTKAPVMDHVQTQLPYALPIILATGFSFWISSMLLDSYGFWLSALIPILAGLIICSLFMIICNYIRKYRFSANT